MGVGSARRSSWQSGDELTLPATMLAVLGAFAPLFSARVWEHAQALQLGAILVPAQRSVAAALRVAGLAQVR